MRFPSLFVRVLCLGLAAVCAPRAATAQESPAALPPLDDAPASIADYTIDVTLDAETHRLHGTQTLRYTNTSPDAIPDLRFHLYLNAFKNERSTFMRESGGVLRKDTMEEDGWGWIDFRHLTVAGADVLADVEYMQPDGTDPDDQTVARVALATPLAPGDSVMIECAFEAQLPKVFARTGYRGDFYLVAQWFPKLGVWESAGMRGREIAGWNCHQFHSTTEFYADFGRYEVRMTVPSDYVVGATGVETARVEHGETTTYTFVQDNVIDFAWTASPRFVRTEATYQMEDWVPHAEVERLMALHDVSREDIALPGTRMILLLQPENAAHAERYFHALGTAITYFGLWYGPYPYDTITLVDPAWKAGGAGGMEYPTFITGGTAWRAPADATGANLLGPRGPEHVTVHEFGHQYWQSMVATNEFEEAWLDEGFNSYSTGLIMDDIYGPAPQSVVFNHMFVPFARWAGIRPLTQAQLAHIGFVVDGGKDALARRAWEYANRFSYGVNSYPKTAGVLRQLHIELGDDTMARIMRAYFQRWRFRHPRAQDFIAVAEDVSGRDLAWFFDRLVFRPGTVDFAVTHAGSTQIGFEAGVFDGAEGRYTRTKDDAADARDAATKAEEPSRYRTTIVVTNHGDTPYPVDILVRFKDGEEVREHWDGSYRWVRYVYERNEELERVIVDPDFRVLMDLNRANNSHVAEPERPTGLRWSLRLLLLVQHLFYSLGGAVS